MVALKPMIGQEVSGMCLNTRAGNELPYCNNVPQKKFLRWSGPFHHMEVGTFGECHVQQPLNEICLGYLDIV